MKQDAIELILYYSALFLLGGIGIYLVTRKQDPIARKKNWLKYFTYFFIVTLLYGCIYLTENIFFWVCLSIVFVGLIEIILLQKKSPQNRSMFYSILFTYTLISIGFCLFSGLSKSLLLYVLFTVCTFDAFSQIAGQLLGKNKICPLLSPNKTFEGLLGGLFVTICISAFIGNILGFSIPVIIILGLSICLFSFVGDLSASWIKRKYGVKDFCSTLPGHGGFLDRFDSLIVSGAFVYIFNYLYSTEHQLLYILLLLLCFLFIITLCEFLHRKAIQIECTRKIAHSLSTLLCLFLPICFSSHYYVLALAIISLSILYIGNKRNMINSILSTERKTYGAYLLPISIGLTYYLALYFSNSLFFNLPIIVLAISDPLACCFGKLYKSKKLIYNKTVIGTLVFFLSTFIICSFILGSQSIDFKTISAALGIAIVVSIVELISSKGSDNLTIPLSIIASLLLFSHFDLYA